MATPATSTAGPGLTVGPTSEFSLFFRVTPGHGETLRAALRDLQDTPGYRPGDYGMAVTSIHEARFVLFDEDTRLAFVTSFDGPWDAYMEDFFTSGPTLALFDVIFRHTEGYEGLPDGTALRSFVLGAQRTAAAYARNYGGTVKELRRAQRVDRAFQQVLDDPAAAEALRHPALRSLLDEAAFAPRTPADVHRPGIALLDSSWQDSTELALEYLGSLPGAHMRRRHRAQLPLPSRRCAPAPPGSSRCALSSVNP
jgi:hypothetical protein